MVFLTNIYNALSRFFPAIFGPSLLRYRNKSKEFNPASSENMIHTYPLD